VKKSPHWLLLLLFINLLQAAFTGLGDDEAYYWMYAQYPDFGYFDHPPMVAWLISAGTLITDSELGARLFGVLLTTLALWLLWLAVDEKHRAKFFPVFILAWLSAPLVHFYGFIITPDAPLIFFAAAFLLVWKKFLEQSSISLSLLLGVIMAGLLYSKFHGVLLIVFSLAANWRLLAKRHYWLACITGALLFVPHLWWQYSRDFPAVYYHFYWRATAFDVQHIIKYITELPLVQGPVLFIPVAIFVWKNRRAAWMKDAFMRSLVFCFAGIVAFFLVTSFRSRIEAHWTLLCAFPALLLLPYLWETYSERARFRLKAGFVISVSLLALVRVCLVADVLPVRTEFHNTDEEVKQLSNACGKLPMVFMNSYRLPAKTGFYTRHQVLAVNEISYRFNQYDLWMLETSLHLRNVMVLDKRNRNLMANDSLVSTSFGEKWFLHRIDTFETYQKIHITLPRVYEPVKRASVLRLPVTMHNPYPYVVRFNHPQMPVSFEAIFLHFKTLKAVTPARIADLPESLQPGETRPCILEITMPDVAETYNLGIGIKAGILGPMFNSNMTLVTTQ
jgi:hypothetical protein